MDTYVQEPAAPTAPMYNQIVMLQLKANPLVWRIIPKYNVYTGGYRSQAPVAMSYDGLSLWHSGNWGDATVPPASPVIPYDVYKIGLPADWASHLNAMSP